LNAVFTATPAYQKQAINEGTTHLLSDFCSRNLQVASYSANAG